MKWNNHQVFFTTSKLIKIKNRIVMGAGCKTRENQDQGTNDASNKINLEQLGQQHNWPELASNTRIDIENDVGTSFFYYS